ncbi:hypothetical protein LWI28_018700 [Acer negundo]|uniref:Uncharacterized protein n=1 Tax=Acer negundo TaxID=4023 RepID=A0AAD5P288_ACENE|nr:hypothetical protein LWI28_018700 [Acer negundo]
MVVVHGDCGRNLNSGAGSVMDPMFMEASLFVRVSSDSPPLNVPRSRPSSQMGHIEASFGSISACAWVDPFMGTCSHSDKGDSVLPSHANGLSSAKGRKPNCDGYGSLCYDPRFVGGDGVMFYFHGAKGGNFAIVSDDNLQINAHFIGTRPQGRTRDYTWVQALAVMFDSHTLVISANRVSNGMTILMLSQSDGMERQSKFQPMGTQNGGLILRAGKLC